MSEQSKIERPYQDGSWHWVKYEGLHKEYGAPAMYKANCDAWYSFDFSGIPTRQVEVLGPCVNGSLPVGVPDGWVNGFPPAGELCEARIPHHTADGMQMLWCEVEVIAHAVIKGVVYSWVKEPGHDGGFYAPLMLSFRRFAADPSAPTVKAEQADATAIQTALAIKVEKLLCSKLGIEWSPSGMSIESLVGQLAAPSLPAAGSAELITEAERCLFVLREIGSMDADDITGDNVDLRFEDDKGRDTGCDVSIVDYAEKSADVIEKLIAALSAQQSAHSESAREVTEGKASIDWEVVEFLRGCGELHGLHFSEALPGMSPFWWRAYLPRKQAAAPERVSVPVELLGRVLKTCQFTMLDLDAAELRALLASHGRGEA